MAKFNGTVDNIENNLNKKSTFDYENPSTTSYLSEAGVKAALGEVEDELSAFLKRDGTNAMTGSLSMGGNAITSASRVTLSEDPSGDNDVGRRSYNDSRYLKVSDKVNAVTSESTNNQIPSASAVYNSVNGCLKTSQKVTSISASSNNNQVPSAKAVYDFGQTLGSKRVNIGLTNVSSDIASLSVLGVNEALVLLLSLDLTKYNFSVDDTDNTKILAVTTNNEEVSMAVIDGLVASQTGYGSIIGDAAGFEQDELLVMRRWAFDTSANAQAAAAYFANIPFSDIKILAASTPEINAEVIE